MWEQAQSLYAHSVLLKHENGDLRCQLQARAAPKRTKPESMAATKVQKHGFLTGPEAKEVFYAEMAKEDEKRRVADKKTAEKEAKAREVEAERSRLMLDSEYKFKGSLVSYKTSLTRLGDLAASLALPFTGRTRADIFAAIESHFEAHPDLKVHPRYASLFLPSNRVGGRRGVQLEINAPSIPHSSMSGGQEPGAAE